MQQLSLIPDSASGGARFSACRTYRYLLWRSWQSELPVLTWVMLNPSKAGETEPDRTVSSCCQRARIWGFGGIRVINLFAWVSTDPAALVQVPDPIGPENAEYLSDAILAADTIVIAWGNLPAPLRFQGDRVLDLIAKSGKIAMALKTNSDGSPAHPLRLAHKLRPFPFTPEHRHD